MPEARRTYSGGEGATTSNQALDRYASNGRFASARQTASGRNRSSECMLLNSQVHINAPRLLHVFPQGDTARATSATVSDWHRCV